MKHIKPGRGPSAMGGIGAVAAAVFGIFWTAIAPGFMKAFGVIFIVIAIAQAVYHFKNAASSPTRTRPIGTASSPGAAFWADAPWRSGG